MTAKPLRTYELNLLVTGGWLSALFGHQSRRLWLISLKKSTDHAALASRYSYVGSIMYASARGDRREILSPIWILARQCTRHNAKCTVHTEEAINNSALCIVHYAFDTGSSRCFRMRSSNAEHSELRAPSCASLWAWTFFNW